jgi:hypothetical protein
VKYFIADEKGEERTSDVPTMLEKITAAAQALKKADEDAERSAEKKAEAKASKEAFIAKMTDGNEEPQREAAVPLHAIQVRMAYLIPPKQHGGWDEKQRSLVTSEEEKQWRELPWKVGEDPRYVQCTICSGRYDIDKDWGNAQCWACSIVDRMELGGNLFVKLLSPPDLSKYVQATNADKPVPFAKLARRASIDSSKSDDNKNLAETLGSLAGDGLVSLNEFEP